MDASFASKVADALSQISYARNVEAEAYAALADAIRELDDDVPVPPDPEPEPEPEPEPTPQPVGSSFGWNAGSALYWAASRPFRNKALLAGLHYGRSDQRPARFDRLGELVSGDAMLPIWLSSAMAEPGTYHVKMQGSGTASPASFVLANSLEVQRFHINLSGDCRGLSVEREGDTGGFVTKEFVARHRGAAAIRLMDLLLTNSGDARDMNHYRVNTDGPSPIIEQTITPYMAREMARGTGTPIWWNWHHRSTDQFVRDVCTEFLAYGDEFPIYFEFSNEIWGPFPAGAYGDTQPGARYKWQNRRTKEVGAIAKEILGERAITVIGTQCMHFGVTQAVLEDGADGIDCLAVAPYLNWFQSAPPTFSDALTRIKQYVEITVLPAILWQRNYAAERGLRLVAYEAGSDLSWHNSASAETLYRRLVESDELADIYADFIVWWSENVDDACLFYCDLNHHGFGHWNGERLGAQPRGEVVQEAIQ